MPARYFPVKDLSVYTLKNFDKVGEFALDSNASYKLKFKDGGGTAREVVTTDHTQTLSNKTVQGVAPVSITTATATLSQASHDGVFVTINRAAGATITLPAATGSGACFKILIGTTLTSGSFVLQVANASDFFRGAAYTVGAAAASFLTANTGTGSTESDTLTFNRTTTGLGTIGDYIEVVDMATNVWSIEAEYASSGTAATPFSAAV